mmetsp:Transcript_26304/g.82743  ORF Transcript_26304/g.82743 Transcript_26304/m.82743 type:complete len:454 (+) Transcript_26304:156-1517(+)
MREAAIDLPKAVLCVDLSHRHWVNLHLYPASAVGKVAEGEPIKGADVCRVDVRRTPEALCHSQPCELGCKVTIHGSHRGSSELPQPLVLVVLLLGPLGLAAALAELLLKLGWRPQDHVCPSVDERALLVVFIPGRPRPQLHQQLREEVRLHRRAVDPQQPPLVRTPRPCVACEKLFHDLGSGRRRGTNLLVGLLTEGGHEPPAQCKRSKWLELRAQQGGVAVTCRITNEGPRRLRICHGDPHCHRGELSRQQIGQVLRKAPLVEGDVQLLQGRQPGRLKQQHQEIRVRPEVVPAGVELCELGQPPQRRRQSVEAIPTKIQLCQRYQALDAGQLRKLVVAEVQRCEAGPRAWQQLQREGLQVEAAQRCCRGRNWPGRLRVAQIVLVRKGKLVCSRQGRGAVQGLRGCNADVRALVTQQRVAEPRGLPDNLPLLLLPALSLAACCTLCLQRVWAG